MQGVVYFKKRHACFFKNVIDVCLNGRNALAVMRKTNGEHHQLKMNHADKWAWTKITLFCCLCAQQIAFDERVL